MYKYSDPVLILFNTTSRVKISSMYVVNGTVIDQELHASRARVCTILMNTESRKEMAPFDLCMM